MYILRQYRCLLFTSSTIVTYCDHTVSVCLSVIDSFHNFEENLYIFDDLKKLYTFIINMNELSLFPL